jgi:hypothetical protein
MQITPISPLWVKNSPDALEAGFLFYPRKQTSVSYAADCDLMVCKGHSVSVLWRGGEVDTIFGFEKEDDALQWIKEKSQVWLIKQNRAKLPQ